MALKTYISKDFGKTWKEIASHPSTFIITKDSNYIILIDEKNPTKNLIISYDHGHNFRSIPLA